jgi:hypothetical protein
MLFLRTMLGLDARDGQVVLDPHIPAEVGRIQLVGVEAFGRRWDLEFTGAQSYVRLAP